MGGYRLVPHWAWGACHRRAPSLSGGLITSSSLLREISAPYPHAIEYPLARPVDHVHKCKVCTYLCPYENNPEAGEGSTVQYSKRFARQ
jgi:hypothetical protein